MPICGGEGISFLSNISTLHLSLSVCLFSTDVTDLEPARLRGKNLIRFMCPKGRSSKRLDGAYFLLWCFVLFNLKKLHYFSNPVEE